MPREQIRQSLEQLRAEIEGTDFKESGDREKLESLIRDIEARVAESAATESPERDETLTQNLRDAIGQFEVEHKSATTLLNQIMVSLGNIGI